MFKYLVFLLFVPTAIYGQVDDSAFAKSSSRDSQLAGEQSGKAKTFQEQLNAKYKNPDSTILSVRELRKFKGLDFWPIDIKYCVEATFAKAEVETPVEIATSTGVPRTYNTYGTVTFEIDERIVSLIVYQNPVFIATPDHKYRDYLMLGFTDYTSGDGSYGGGRYVDIKLTDIIDGKIIIDFNQAYNPYCAYTSGYSCAIPPEENDIKVRIEAGVKDYKKGNL